MDSVRGMYLVGCREERGGGMCSLVAERFFLKFGPVTSISQGNNFTIVRNSPLIVGLNMTKI